MTACDLNESIVSIGQLKMQATYAFRFMRKHIAVNTYYISRNMGGKRFQTAKVTFKVTQGRWCWCHSIGYIWLPCSLP